ncbi:recombinase family protein [Falsiroseomonas sp.]|uniref:recombinase family protein n=1 Tax=Falsiroseomonas sp. TaxID=2870721 RepID=UPI0034A1755B
MPAVFLGARQKAAARLCSWNRAERPRHPTIRIRVFAASQQTSRPSATGPFASSPAANGARRFRPEFQRLLGDAKARKLNAVVCEALDRLGRELADIASLEVEVDPLLWTP